MCFNNKIHEEFDNVQKLSVVIISKSTTKNIVELRSKFGEQLSILDQKMDRIKNRSRKVITRDGKPVRIVCWDSPNKAFPIVGFIDDNPTVFVWDNYGYSKAGHVESKCDLFFAEEEEKLTEFEKEYKKLYMEGYADGQAGSKPLSA